MANSNTPPITLDTKVLCFDIETSDLHGTPFAIGAVLMDGHGVTHATFQGRCPAAEDLDPWVRDNVLPAIKNMPQTHGNYEALREAFWQWYLRTKEQADYVLVSNGYPVEYGFLHDAQHANLAERYWQHPFPILDLTSMLVALGDNPDTSKSKLRRQVIKEQGLSLHNPFDDAKLTVLVMFAALSAASNL